MSKALDMRLGSTEYSANTLGQVAGVASALLTVVLYLLWLGWHEPKHLVPGTSNEVGPHEAWQVIGFALSLGIIAAAGGWLRLVKPTVWGTTLAVTAAFSVEAATEHQDDASMWQIGAAMLFAASIWGLLLVAIAFQGLRNALSSRVDV